MLALIATLALAAAPSTHQAVVRMQAFYEKTRDLQADFEQTFINPTFHKTLHSTGTLSFKKPGMLRFDYAAPEPKLFVVKGDHIISYIPAAQQAMEGSFKADQLSASVTFLWGKGQLEKEFDVSSADRKDLADGIALLLTPKRADPRFQKIYFVVDPSTYAVKQSVVIDGAGDENRFDFKKLKPNAGIADSLFDFKPPDGTEITQMGAP